MISSPDLRTWLDLDMRICKINETLFPSSRDPSIARQSPNPEADTVWEEWGVDPRDGEGRLDSGQIPRRSWGFGDDAYAVTFDVFHQLHCLDETPAS